MRYRNVVAFLALGTIWGSAFVAIKAGLSAFPPVLFAALRYDVAGVLVLGYAAIVTDPLPESRRDLAAIAVGATLLIAGYHSRSSAEAHGFSRPQNVSRSGGLHKTRSCERGRKRVRSVQRPTSIGITDSPT